MHFELLLWSVLLIKTKTFIYYVEIIRQMSLHSRI